MARATRRFAVLSLAQLRRSLGLSRQPHPTRSDTSSPKPRGDEERRRHAEYDDEGDDMGTLRVWPRCIQTSFEAIA